MTGLPEVDRSLAEMRWNTPLSEAHAELLLDRLELPAARSVLDLGCGWGELLIRAVAASGSPGARGIGVETHPGDLERGRVAAAERGLAERVDFVEQPAETWTEPADRVICIGASHIWGGTPGMLRALAGAVAPDGLVLVGDGFWAREPSPRAVEIFGDEVVPLADLVRQAHDGGWRVLHISEADQHEWDDFETTWKLGRHRWIGAHPADERGPAVREELRERTREYLEVYRGVLGFAYLVLAR